MTRHYPKRKPLQTWRVVPVRITPKLKRPDPIPQLLRAFALTYTGTAPASESSIFTMTLNQYLSCQRSKLTIKTLQTWERGLAKPPDFVLLSLLRNAPPLSWPWLLANDLLATIHPDRYQPQSLIAQRILNLEGVKKIKT